MSIRLSRKKINDMVDRDYSFSSSRSGGGSGAGGGGGVSSQWVDEHYVSKEFFARLFTVNGTDENDDDVVVEPNDLKTTITNIQMMVGAWTKQYLSALGLSDGGGGGGSVIALQDLVNVEYVGTPSGGQILKYNGTTGKWYNADDGGGTVQDVTLAMPAGFDVRTATNQGTIALTVSLDRGEGASALGNKLFLATPVTGSGAPSWRAITADDIGLGNYTWWGQNFNGTANVSGDMTDVGSITANGNMTIGTYNGSFVKLIGTSYSFGIHLGGGGTNRGLYDFTSSLDKWLLYFDASNTIMNYGNVGIGTVSPGAKLDVNGQMRATTFLSCHNGVGTNGAAGWVRLAIVSVGSAYASQPLKFKVSQRGRVGGEITLRFANVAAAANTKVEEFSYTGNLRDPIIVRSNTDFSLYVRKSENYDDIGISLVDMGSYMNSKVSITWDNTLTSFPTDQNGNPDMSQISGGTLATCRYYFSQTAYMEWDATNKCVHFNTGVYSDSFISALGANGSGGSGSATKLDDLTNVTITNPTNGQALVYRNSQWVNETISSGGSGTVASVGLTMPTGFTVTSNTSNPITGTGTFTVTANGTMVPNLNADKLDGYEASGLFETLKNSTASGHTNDIEIKIGNTTKYLTVGYATSAGSATTAGSASTAGSATTAESCTGNAATASKLSGNASGPFTAWGNTFWNNGVPQSVSGDMSNVGNITAMTESNNYTKVITGFHSLTLRHNGSNGGHLDFFWNGASSYTSRIIEGASKRLDINDTIFVFHTSSSSNDGCVGIGTTNPGFTLNVNGYTYTHRLYLAPGVYLEYDNNGGVHLVGAGFYADTFVSALGANSSSGGGGIDLNTMWNALENSASTHSIGTSTNGLNALYATSIYANGVQVLTSSNGVTIATAQTISGAKTFSGNLLAKKIQMTASNAATYLEHTKLYSPNATMTIQGSDSAQNLSLCAGGGNVAVGASSIPNNLNSPKFYVKEKSCLDGNVGIGTAPSADTDSTVYKLKVSGKSYFSEKLTVNGFIIEKGTTNYTYNVGAASNTNYAQGTWSGYFVSSGSDIRLKDIIRNVDLTLEDVAHAPIFEFTYKDKRDDKIHLGTSAQYWQPILPSAICTLPDNYLTMEYQTAALAAAVMTARTVLSHEARIKQLERENEQLRKELAAVQTTPNPS